MVLYTDTYNFKDILNFVTRSERVSDILCECAWRMFKTFKTEITVISYDKTSEAEVFVSIVDDWSNA
jgi:hypothetical protein